MDLIELLSKLAFCAALYIFSHFEHVIVIILRVCCELATLCECVISAVKDTCDWFIANYDAARK